MLAAPKSASFKPYHVFALLVTMAILVSIVHRGFCFAASAAYQNLIKSHDPKMSSTLGGSGFYEDEDELEDVLSPKEHHSLYGTCCGLRYFVRQSSFAED